MRRVAQVLVDVFIAAGAIACMAMGVIVGYAGGATVVAIGLILAGIVLLYVATRRWEP